jgi:hypothetical protein|tara:strand:+ start:4289 stop:5878 length:1590 start_codon:yes stop_codon:yes gene_type:complete
MKKRNLPEWYAKAFMEKAKPTFFSRTIGWEDFESVMNERESTMLRAFNSLGLSRSGMMKESDVKQSLKRLGLPATPENATAMLNHMGMNGEGYVSYGQFRNFLMLLPRAVATSKDPSVLWFEASTMVQVNPPESARSATAKLAIQAAIAGALAAGSSTALMHPMDTLKTRIQATVGAGPGLKAFFKQIPQIGARNLYRGIIPAVVGAASGHGFRTATYEVACKLLAPLTLMPLITEIQIQGFGSGLGTLVGTSVRIPCEVLKQRLQTGQFTNVAEAFKAVTANGPKGLFAGTAATLSREVPFYVIGLVTYEKLKIAAGAIKRKDLSAWETISLGGLAGAIAAACTTPADVLKTRAMTGASPAGEAIWITVKKLVATEGAGALMKGCVPRMVWIAPLGAMNFAGYELAKRAMQAADEDPSAKKEPEKSIKLEPERAARVNPLPAIAAPPAAAPIEVAAPAPAVREPVVAAAETAPVGVTERSSEEPKSETVVEPTVTESAPEMPPVPATPAPASSGFRSLPPKNPPPVER